MTGAEPRRRLAGSLSGRMTLTTLGVLAVVLVVLFVAVDVVLGARLDSVARGRLTDRAAIARQLGATLGPAQLVNRLRGDGVTARLCAPDDGSCVTSDSAGTDSTGTAGAGGNGAGGNGAGGNGAGGNGGVGPGLRRSPFGAGRPVLPRATSEPVRTDGAVLSSRTTLRSGALLTLSTDTSQGRDVLRRLLVLEAVGGLLALAVAALAMRRLSRLALRPLEQMTGLARAITAGDRGRRLRDAATAPGTRRRPGTGSGPVAGAGTELDRTAEAFDGMLDELEDAAARARAAEERMRSFLGDASHELRTPLTGITANAELLLRGRPGPAETEEAAVAVVREARRATRLVESLLEMARLDRGVRLEPAAVDLAALARGEADRLRTVAPGLAVRVRGDGDGPWARADPARISQVVANLLDNARRAAGPAGTVTVATRATAGGAELSVSDDGPGIPAPDRERVFHRFTRLDGSRSRTPGATAGTGLGLAISRELARASGGELVATDRPDGCPGAHLVLTLPAAASEAPQPVPVSG